MGNRFAFLLRVAVLQRVVRIFRLDRCRQMLKEASPKANKNNHEDLWEGARNIAHSVLSCTSL